MGPDRLAPYSNLVRWLAQAGDAKGAVDELTALLPDCTRALGCQGTLTAQRNLNTARPQVRLMVSRP
ncbi:hypothetical protein OHB33_23220 [Streptomyces sp. NBC_01558]|uniref:hypothetical protein n=1 Tax=Streptomyces sp. NBC_01558 TaxID=2975878 RepID=UPI002DD7EFB1|nr:hypothetical protein [Streptomyces sp. NBC_01558]WSD78988.1 hypothetical protein OHB33_23220 [Streptomyces sp. NBC_01558]